MPSSSRLPVLLVSLFFSIGIFMLRESRELVAFSIHGHFRQESVAIVKLLREAADLENRSNQEHSVVVNSTHSNKTRHGVVILGMHRSGTSMLSGLLVTGCGYNVGGPLLSAAPSNPKGFFELESVVYQNERFMKNQHVRWRNNVLKYNASLAIQEKDNGSVSFTNGTRALEFFNNRSNAPWLQKDPRMCVTLKTWLPLLNTEPAIVFTYRNPLQVALSLQSRDDIGLKHGLRLWIMYNMLAIQNSKGMCRVWTSNIAILRDPWNEIQRISNELTNKCGVWRPSYNVSKEIVDTFVDPNLQHKENKKGKQVSKIGEFEECKVYDYDNLLQKGSQKQMEEMGMYKKAMKIYCDLESGKAYEADYEWPEV